MSVASCWNVYRLTLYRSQGRKLLNAGINTKLGRMAFMFPKSSPSSDDNRKITRNHYFSSEPTTDYAGRSNWFGSQVDIHY